MFVAVPNVSEGRDVARLERLSSAVTAGGARLLDVHRDAAHHRSVLTVAGGAGELPQALADLAVACKEIDLTRHRGVHPTLGVLDVCPIVTWRVSTRAAIAVAEATGTAIAARAHLPVYLYGLAARRAETRDLPDLRAGGLDRLIERARSGLIADAGPHEIDPRHGVVCVGARPPLIAFNVWLECDLDVARAIAARLRTTGGGLPGVRALGLQVESLCQVSINLIDPDVTGIDAAFVEVERMARDRGRVVATEIVGLVPERYLPEPGAKAARLLIEPGRSLEAALSAG